MYVLILFYVVTKPRVTPLQRCCKCAKTGGRAPDQINCPFLLSGNFSTKRGNWRLNVLEGSHNHEPSFHPSVHPTHRKFTSEQADTVKNMTLAGIKPFGNLSAIRMTNEGTLATLRTVYNGRLKLRKDMLNGRTPIQAFMMQIYALSQMR